MYLRILILRQKSTNAMNLEIKAEVERADDGVP
jgi:hypothetical protein